MDIDQVWIDLQGIYDRFFHSNLYVLRLSCRMKNAGEPGSFMGGLGMRPQRFSLQARLHGRFLSQQLGAIFVALKLQLQNRTCKLGAIFIAICRRDIAGVSNMFET